ncbi:MAG: serine/threonine protein kinase [Planctomycetes bacterium]|nr:serine/threonine protein kinase [Planctomycetota bacterium]
MSISDSSQLGRLLSERKLCTANELDLVRNELRELADKGRNTNLVDLLVERGYVTRSQIARLNMAMDEDSMYRPAQQIPGYQILGKVGQGAMAVVFKAKQLSLDRIVAIKVLPKRLSENQEFVDRFYREGRAAAKLNHANIVAAYDVGEAGGYHYFVMEFIDGQTVYDLLQKGEPLEEALALDIVIQCARALGHAHDCGLIHRDVKPKNIMITKSGHVKLADMGLAREIDDYETAAAEAGRAYGTPYYISPEQIRGEIKIEAQADIYALGATFYHMVTCKVPFEGTSPTVVMHKHLKQALVPPDHLNHRLSSGHGEIIEVMMAKSADDRYANVEELISDLEAVGRGEPPLQARRKYNHDLLETLANGGETVELANEVPSGDTGDGRISLHWVLVLGVLLAISLLGNLVFLAR